MPTPSEMLADIDAIFADGTGTQIRLRYFTGSVAAGDYDDAQTLVQSGADLWTTGLYFPLSQDKSSYDPSLVEQGMLLSDDSKLYVKGTVSLSGIWNVGIGSPVRATYGPIDGGAPAWVIAGTPVYKKAYIRVITMGSYIGQ